MKLTFLAAATLTALATPVIAEDDWINRDCNKYGASAVPAITPGSLSPYVLEKLRQKDAPRIEAARQECEWRKRQQKEAKAAEQARQAAAERERKRQAEEQAAERERQAQERERQRQAYEALSAEEKAALAAAAAARKAEQEAVELAREAAFRKQMVTTRLLNGYRFYAHVKWCHDVRDGYLVQYVNDAELARARTAIKALVEQTTTEEMSIKTDDVWQQALNSIAGHLRQDNSVDGFIEACQHSLRELFKLSPVPVYTIPKP